MSVALPDWFSMEIDRVAMREGLVGTDAYLEEWSWSGAFERPGLAAEVARRVAAELATDWGHPSRDATATEEGGGIE